MKLRHYIKLIFPPILHDLIKHVIGKRDNYVWGDFRSWDEALASSSGYDANNILNKVKEANLKVKHGQAVFERDSVIFDEVQPSYPVLAGLLRVALAKNNNLSVLDYGGSLGSSYHQCRSFLADLNELFWGIVEQEQFVAIGQELFETEHLKFFYSIDEFLQSRTPNVVLLSGVVQYLREPHIFLSKLVDYQFEYIILDRTSFVELPKDRLMIQVVPATIYKASYPVWFFNQEQFLEHFGQYYELIDKFDSFETWKIGELIAQNRGFILKRRKQAVHNV